MLMRGFLGLLDCAIMCSTENVFSLFVVLVVYIFFLMLQMYYKIDLCLFDDYVTTGSRRLQRDKQRIEIANESRWLSCSQW